jgi:hypothetical protein
LKRNGPSMKFQNGSLSSPLPDPEPDDFSDKKSGQRFLSRKTDRSLARIVGAQLLRERRQCRTGIKGAMVRARGVGYQKFPIQAKSRDPIADALLGSGRGCLDRFAQFLECLSFFFAEFREIIVMTLRLPLSCSRSLLRFHHIEFMNWLRASFLDIACSRRVLRHCK